MQQTEKYWRLIILSAVVAIVVMVGIGTTLIFTPAVQKKNDFQHRLSVLEKELKEQKRSTEEVAQKARRIASDREFVERIAHEVGYAHPDETIYHFPAEMNNE